MFNCYLIRMPADIGALQDAAQSRREKLMAMRAKVTITVN